MKDRPEIDQRVRRETRRGYRGGPRVSPYGRRRPPEHIVIVERALGHALRVGAPVHHVDRDGLNNDPSNLVACHDHAYHMLLHRRQRALDACGNANAVPCRHCGKHDRQGEMYTFSRPDGSPAGYHRDCHAAYTREYRSKRFEQLNVEPAPANG